MAFSMQVHFNGNLEKLKYGAAHPAAPYFGPKTKLTIVHNENEVIWIVS